MMQQSDIRFLVKINKDLINQGTKLLSILVPDNKVSISIILMCALYTPIYKTQCATYCDQDGEKQCFDTLT